MCNVVVPTFFWVVDSLKGRAVLFRNQRIKIKIVLKIILNKTAISD